MTRTARAALLADRADQEAARLRTVARRAVCAGRQDALYEAAARQDRTAAEWRAAAVQEAAAEGLELRECCLVDISAPCTPECGCGDCDAERALDDDADAYFD